MSNKDKIVIVMADDNDDDKTILKEAFNRAQLDIGKLVLVDNGADLIEKLSSEELKNKPVIILLDLNMPHKNGYQALKEIKQEESTKKIPIIIWTTSSRQEDIDQCYSLGANSYIVKPDRLKGVVDAVKTMWMYWIDLVEMPTRD